MKNRLEEVKKLQKIAGIIKENAITEAFRIGNSSWSDILDDLSRIGWTKEGEIAKKYYTNDNEEQMSLEITNYDGDDEIRWTIFDENNNELESGSFDAEGLSAGEIDSEIWSQLPN